MSITTEETAMEVEDLKPVSPGEILLEEFLKPLGVSQNRLARDIDIPVSRISDIIKGRRAVTADTAMRLSAYFRTSARFWLNLQADFDLQSIRQSGWEETKARIRPLNAEH